MMTRQEARKTMDEVKRTGMIGLGAMGLQFARHMMRNGFDVAGYDVSADCMQRAGKDGIKQAASPPTVIGEHAEVVVVMVATDAQVDSVVEGSGLLDALAPGSVICIASSVAQM